jgi:hypothetical protein
VSKSRLIKRARRELTANPKKTAALGLLVAVGLYYWIPLVWGVRAPAQPNDTAGTREIAGTKVLPPGWAGKDAMEKARSETNESASYPWRQIVQWRERDPRTTPAADLGTGRDPFQIAKQKLAEAEAKAAKERAKQEKPTVPTWSPETLGLHVSSTIVGPRRSVALINGSAYSQGETIELTKDGQSVVWTLAEIHPGRIVLRGGNQQIELIIPERGTGRRVDMLGSRLDR